MLYRMAVGQQSTQGNSSIGYKNIGLAIKLTQQHTKKNTKNIFKLKT